MDNYDLKEIGHISPDKQFVIFTLDKMVKFLEEEGGDKNEGKVRKVTFIDIMNILSNGEELFLDESSYDEFVDIGYRKDASFESSLMIIPNEDEETFYQIKSFRN